MPDRIVDPLSVDPPINREKSRQLPPFARKLLRHALAVAVTVSAVPLPAAFAAQPVSSADQPLTPSMLEALVADYLHTQTAGVSETVRVEVTWPADANRLPPCSVAVPELLPGQRLWGRVAVALRCLAPQPWQINVPVVIRRFGPYVVTTRPLQPRSEVTTEDLTVLDGELTFMPEDVVRNPGEAAGKVVRVGIAPGQPLRSAWLERPIAVRNSDTVKVIHQGGGFRVETEGRAMNGASLGERVRVRLSTGQVVDGIATRPGVVTITP